MFKAKKIILMILLFLLVVTVGCNQNKINEEVLQEKIIVQGQGEVKLKENSSGKVKLKAVPQEHWKFVCWQGVANSTKNPQVITVEKEIQLMAKFKYVGPDITGTGTADDPFVIYTLQGLEKIGQSGYSLEDNYKLGKNIDASKTLEESYNEGLGWEPIAKLHSLTEINPNSFSGIFDGQGYQIKNLYIKYRNLGAGLFGVIKGGIIKDLNLADVKVDGRNVVGGLAGLNDNGTIINISLSGKTSGILRVGGIVGINNGIMQKCQMRGRVIGRGEDPEVERTVGDYIGLLVGENDKVIENSYSQGKVEGYSSVGGAVGLNNGRIENVYATAEVIGETRVGGLLGYNKFLVKNTYFRGTIKNINGPGRIGGLIGHNDKYGNVKKSYWKTKTILHSDGGLGVSDAQLAQKSTYENWNFNHVWAIDEEKGQPYLQMKDNEQLQNIYEGPDITGKGTKKDPFTIYTFSGLEKISTSDYPLDAWYELGRNINASPTQSEKYNNGQGWKPIGEHKDVDNGDYKAFKGKFNGNYYKISNLYINRPESDFVALFEIVEDGFVTNLRLVNVDINGDRIVGGVAGFNGVEIKNVDVSGKIKGNDYIGGLCGDNGNKVNESFFKGEVKGANYVGGLAGDNRALIINSYAHAEIKGEGIIGGVAGKNEYKIKNSTANNIVKGDLDAIGGLTGYNKGVIIDSFAENEVIGKLRVGGLVGINYELIKTSYALGTVKGEENIGGLTGYNTGTIKKSYASAMVDGGKEHIGGLVGYSSGKIYACYSNSKIKGDYFMGGLVGLVEKGEIKNSYTQVEIEGKKYIGGLVGYSLEGQIKNTYSVSKVKGEKIVGPLVGGDIGKIEDSYWKLNDLETSNENGKTSHELKQKSTFENWNFESRWQIDEGESYPYLQWEKAMN